MARHTVRVSVDEALWAAVEAAARARRILPHLFVEEALTAALSSSDAVARLTGLAETAAASAREARASAAEMQDQIQVISDFIVDLYRAEARASDDTGEGQSEARTRR